MIKKRVHLVYSIALSVMLVITGICLCVACVGIYLSGEQPFSREAVAAAFGYIAVPVYLCLALLAGGFFLDGFFPAQRKKAIEKQPRMILWQLQKKLALDSCEVSLRDGILAQQKKRRILKIVGLVLLAVCSAVFLSYGLNSKNFHQSQINASMLRAMGLFIPCLAIPFGYGIFSAYGQKKSICKEIELSKQAIAAGAHSDTPAVMAKQNHSLLYLRLVLLCVGIAILVYGFFAGGTADVMTKAVNICTECVGLG